MQGGGGAGGRWKGEMDPVLRLGVVQRISPMLAEFRETPEQLHQLAANFEEDIFSDAQSKIDYMRRVSNRVIAYQKLINLRDDADRQQQQTQMVHQMPLADTVQAIHGVNYPFAATPQGVPATASPSWPLFQSQNQHMTRPFPESNMWTYHVDQGPPDMMPMFYLTMNSQPATVAPMAPTVQPSEQIMHSIYMQGHNQSPAMQLQPPTDVARGHLASSAAQLQGQPIAGPNGQQNHFLERNVFANAQHLQPTTTHPQHFGITQHRVGKQSYQMLGANVENMNNNSSSGCDNQQNAGWASGLQSPLKACEQVAVERQTNMESQPMPPALKQITVNQKSNVHCPSPQNPARMGSAGEVNWREEMLQEIKTLKDTYFSELMEINQSCVVPKLTEEQLKSLPAEKADQHKHMLHHKSCVSDVLNFLQLEKSLETYKGELPKYQKTIEHILSFYRERKACNAEMNTGQESKNCPRKHPPQTIHSIADTGQFTGGISDQEKLPPDESIGQMSQDIVRTPSAGEKTHLNHLQETSPYLSSRSPGTLQSLPTNTVELFCMLSPIAKLGAASPSAILNSTAQSPIAKPRVVAAALPSVSVKSTLTSSLDIENSGFGAADSPCESVKSASSATAKSGNVPIASPSDRDSSFLLHNNAAENGCRQASPTKLWTPAPQCHTQTPADQAEDQEPGRAKTLVAKKPIDRLIAAVRSSSPTMLKSADNLMKSALSDMDSVPLISIGSKCVYNLRLPSESRILGSTATIDLDTSDSKSSLYLRLKRWKTQNDKDALLDEIAATNNRLIDTLISVTSNNRADGTASCNGVTLVKLSYTAVSLSPGLKSHFETSGFQPLVVPVTLLIPAGYPKISPVIMDNEGDAQLRTKFNCISVAVDEAFRLALRNLQEPRSLDEMARAWDSCVRRTIKEYVSRLGGGMLTSNLGWCVGLIGEWTKVECRRLE